MRYSAALVALLLLGSPPCVDADDPSDSKVASQPVSSRAVLRRLNRVEYENTIRDLLGIEVDLKDLLPLDSAANGFDNVGEALHVFAADGSKALHHPEPRRG